MNRWLVAAMALIAVLLALLLRDYLTVDRCFDNGGVWVADSRSCSY